MSAAEVALVTGGGSGIGAQTARLLAERGLHVIVAGRTSETLGAVCREIEQAGGSAEHVVVDCGSEAGIDALVSTVGERPLRALVHSAAMDPVRNFVDFEQQDFDAVMALNVGAPFFLTQRLLPRFVDGASVVFVGSVSAKTGLPRHALYGASKAALRGLTVNLAVELAPRIRVNTVSPGATDTAMLAAFLRDSLQGLSEKEQVRRNIAGASRQVLRRAAQPVEVARSIVHLALDATAVTGVDLPVDVGYTAS